MQTRTIALTKSDVDEYMALYGAHFGIDLDFEVAYEQASSLVRIVGIVSRPFEPKVQDKRLHDAEKDIS